MRVREVRAQDQARHPRETSSHRTSSPPKSITSILYTVGALVAVSEAEREDTASRRPLPAPATVAPSAASAASSRCSARRRAVVAAATVAAAAVPLAHGAVGMWLAMTLSSAPVMVRRASA